MVASLGRTRSSSWRDVERTFASVEASILGTAPAEVHDRYFTIGPDGRKYRTWHPASVALDPHDPSSPLVHFGHDHGDPPHVAAPPPPFGYVAFHANLHDQLADHAAYKVFTHKRGWLTGFGTAELGDVAPDWDMQLCVHMGTSSRTRLIDRFHATSFWSRDPAQRVTETHFLADGGVLEDRGGPARAFAGRPRRIVASHAHPTWESWSLFGNVGEVWFAPFVVAVVNPVTHVHGDVGDPERLVLVATATEPDVSGDVALSLGHPRSAWLGQQRVLYGADWLWRNPDGPELFHTMADGRRVVDACHGQDGVLRQRVPTIEAQHGPSGPWDRSATALGWERLALPAGVPGGN